MRPDRFQTPQHLHERENNDMGALDGRVAIITFHSLEDRLVKNFFKKGSFEDEDLSDPFGQTKAPPPLKAITKKPVTPGDTELRQNPRSRSAKLRVAQRV